MVDEYTDKIGIRRPLRSRDGHFLRQACAASARLRMQYIRGCGLDLAMLKPITSA